MSPFWIALLSLTAVVFIAFTFVILFGAPFLPTLPKQVEPALDLLDLKPGQTLLELGSGDGRILKAAAERGIYAVGFELNPFLVVLSMLKCLKYRQYVTVVWGNYWHKDWPKADGIFTFLLNPYMPKLDEKLKAYKHKPIKLVSFAFEVPGKKPAKQRQGLFLYNYK